LRQLIFLAIWIKLSENLAHGDPQVADARAERNPVVLGKAAGMKTLKARSLGTVQLCAYDPTNEGDEPTVLPRVYSSGRKGQKHMKHDIGLLNKWIRENDLTCIIYAKKIATVYA
jgi:hypothetical protein